MESIEFIPVESLIEVTKKELESINRGLKDFDEGNIHSHETALKIYGKYLSNIECT
jgi:predicted transcriptional regulator